jgi:quercetin dioxygenase-like cupin family protein
MKGLIVRGRTEGERRWFAGGGVHLWKVTAEESGGDFFLFEDLLVEGKTTPLHKHPDIAETLYILEGTLLVHVDGAEREVGPGDVAMFPRGVPHALLVTSPTARILCFQTPGSGQPFYLEASDPTTTNAGPVDVGRLREAAGRHHETIEILGPPPFAARQR